MLPGLTCLTASCEGTGGESFPIKSLWCFQTCAGWDKSVWFSVFLCWMCPIYVFTNGAPYFLSCKFQARKPTTRLHGFLACCVGQWLKLIVPRFKHQTVDVSTQLLTLSGGTCHASVVFTKVRFENRPRVCEQQQLAPQFVFCAFVLISECGTNMTSQPRVLF